MEQKINTQLNLIEKSIKWVKETDSMQGPKGDKVHRNLVNFRRKLNKKKFALEGNPAAAMYGESQMGKSYLVSSLLSKSGDPFKVLDGQGNSYDFINKINPIGRGAESTSLVTRFSTNYVWEDPNFPVKAKLLSIADLVLVLCDSYYNDVKARVDIALTSESINDKVMELCAKYENNEIQQVLLGEDDILDIQDYFISNFSTKATNIIHSSYFEKTSSLISSTKPDDWGDFFALLWNNNRVITNLFKELITQFGKLNFAQEVYLPIDAVLRDNGTVLDVSRLHEIYTEHSGSELNFKAQTSIMVLTNEQGETINNFSKSYLCALAAELIFPLSPELETSKPFLRNTDLLDFPGARHRLGILENDIDEKIIPQMLLRGKVAYLFNKYSYSEKINILLFCHNDKQSAQSVMPEMLNNWISDMVGKTSEERNSFIENSKVPPLFVVSTMFNLDLEFDYNNDREGNRSFLDSRWEKRFHRVLKREIFGTDTYDWLNDWTTKNKNFQNIYLLRDLYYSSETNSKIYEGYNEGKIEKQEIIPQDYPNFRNDLQQSFVEYDFVNQYFEDPNNSWKKAVSLNEDGTGLIIEKLTVAADNINSARHEKIISELNDISGSLIHLLNEYYNSSDKADSLLKAIRIAGDIQANLDIEFGKNPYFFGAMMNELMLTNSEVYTLYLNKIHDIEHRNVVNMDKYSAIKVQVSELNPRDSFENNLEFLRRYYEKSTAEECQNFFENEKGIDLNELFYGNNDRVINFSQVLAEALETYWFEDYMTLKKQNLSEVFSEEGFLNVQDMLRRLFSKLDITKIIAKRIRHYVDNSRTIEEVYEMIADISAEIINKFINSVGSEYYNESNLQDLETASQNIKVLKWEHNELQVKQNSKSEVAELIAKMADLPELLNRNPLPKEELKLIPNYRNYFMWNDLLKAGFVTASGVPDYDPISNKKLNTIINESKSLQY
jgi:hypothetical protein